MLFSLLGIILLLMGLDGIDASVTDGEMIGNLILSVAGLAFFAVGVSKAVKGE
jgi:uncharacterized membrane protein